MNETIFAMEWSPRTVPTSPVCVLGASAPTSSPARRETHTAHTGSGSSGGGEGGDGRGTVGIMCGRIVVGEAIVIVVSGADVFHFFLRKKINQPKHK